MNEFELIDQLTPGLPQNSSVVLGPGDDCAILDLGSPTHWTLFKTDAVVEGIHFLPDTPPEAIGRKALARCLSDIAAMGGEPISALVTLALPRHFDPARIEGLYSGMKELAEHYDVAISGGETTTNPDRLLLSIALVGQVRREEAVLRSGARPGDGIFVTGELGGSLLGKHLSFEPRLREAQWLASHFHPHAMMDISDGLAGDLPHILRASKVGAELLSEAIPISRAAKLQARNPSPSQASDDPHSDPTASDDEQEADDKQATGTTPRPKHKSALEAALTDGEDFELLFTLPSRKAVPLVDAWKKQFPETRLSCIGRITATPGLQLRSRKTLVPLTAHGYVHFG